MIYGLLVVVHVLICVFLVIVVLLQSGKAADLAGAFGGMGSQTAFGPRGSATILSKATTIAAALFMITSLTLAIMATKGTVGGTSILERTPVPASVPARSLPSRSVPANKPNTVQVPLPPPSQTTPAQQQNQPAPGTPAAPEKK